MQDNKERAKQIQEKIAQLDELVEDMTDRLSSRTLEEYPALLEQAQSLNQEIEILIDQALEEAQTIINDSLSKGGGTNE